LIEVDFALIMLARAPGVSLTITKDKKGNEDG